jgi:putative transposase
LTTGHGHTTTYPSALSNEQWAQLERFIPALKPGGRPAKYERREVVNALLYLARTGGQGRALPHDFPPWDSGDWYFRTGKRDGPLDRLHDGLRGDLRQAHGRPRPPAAALLDSQSVRTTEQGAPRVRRGPAGPRPPAAPPGRGAGPDPLGGRPAADLQDRNGAKLVLEPLRHRFSRLRVLLADSISQGGIAEWVRSLRARHRLRLEVKTKRAGATTVEVLPWRWRVEGTFAWLGRWRRLSQDSEGGTPSSEAFIKLARIPLRARRRARKLSSR